MQGQESERGPEIEEPARRTVFLLLMAIAASVIGVGFVRRDTLTTRRTTPLQKDDCSLLHEVVYHREQFGDFEVTFHWPPPSLPAARTVGRPSAEWLGRPVGRGSGGTPDSPIHRRTSRLEET